MNKRNIKATSSRFHKGAERYFTKEKDILLCSRYFTMEKDILPWMKTFYYGERFFTTEKDILPRRKNIQTQWRKDIPPCWRKIFHHGGKK